MRESIDALRATISELAEADAVLPDDLAERLRDIIAEAQRLLDTLTQPTPK